MADKAQLLKEIHETSFAVNDLTLYLDTHSQDIEALQHMKCCMQQKKTAMETFAKEFYPLTIDCVSDASMELGQWAWANAPAPWEGDANHVEL